MRIKRWFLLSVLLAAAPFLDAQDQAPQVPRKLLLHVEQAGGTGYSQNELLMISRSIMLSLQNAVGNIIVIESPDGQLPASGSRINELAQAAKADCWLWIGLSNRGKGTSVRVRSFDISTSEQTFDQALGRDARISVLDLPYEKWRDIASLISQRYAPGAGMHSAQLAPPDAQAQSAPSGAAVLTIHALPGTVISEDGIGASATTGTDGTAQLRLPAPAEYSLRATLTNYHEAKEDLFLSSDRTIDIVQHLISRWALDFSMQDIESPGIDLSRFIVPNFLFVKLGFTTRLIGLALTNDAVFLNEPLTTFALQGGIYFRPEDVLFRFYGALGGFLRVRNPVQAAYLDPLAPAGVQISLGAEIGAARHGGFFFEWEPTFYFALEPDFQNSFGNNGTAGWFFPSWGALDILTVRIGYRLLI
jgi:hypothetical protein